MQKQRIIDWTQAHREEYIADLERLVAVRSVRGEAQEGKPYGEGPAAALALALELCGRCGLKTTNYENYVGAADLAPTLPPTLDVLAHLDVVGEGDGWSSDPYTLTLRDDGCLYGRGVADDKGGLLAAAYAMRCVRELGIRLRGNCRLILGCDEESGMDDTEYYYRRVPAAPCTASPDASFPVGNVEKGIYRIRFRREIGAESALPRVVRYRGGFRDNVVAAEATAYIAGMDARSLQSALLPLAAEIGVQYRVETEGETVKLTVCGKGCHAAEPEKGNNGNTALLRLLCELPLADCASARALQALNGLFPHGDFSGRAIGIAQSDERSGALTCSFTMLDFDGGTMEGLCDCRVPLCASEENCKAVADAALREAEFEPAGFMIAGHYTPADTPFVRTLLRCYEQFSGQTGYCYSMGGATYVHYVDGGVAFGPEMPGFDTRMHGADERMPVEHLMRCIEIYAAAIAELCGE